jgi:glycosyltransferase involved in cell wall biosynthesis
VGANQQAEFGIVAIGRNEGERLKRCLASLPSGIPVVYVDSGSTDGSPTVARDSGAQVVSLDRLTPFTAARARNAGFARLLEVCPDLAYVQFIDGDCELVRPWPPQAISFLEARKDVAAVAGFRRELYPQRSIYNQLADWEWVGATGEVRAIGGDVMIRGAALQSVGGYCEHLIAGEEPEVCVRLRSKGWRIWRLPLAMTRHDAAMTHFVQWWRRTLRGGYAYAEGSAMHGHAPEHHWVWESRRAWLWGIWLPLVCLIVSFAFPAWGWASWLLFPLQVIRQAARGSGSLKQRAVIGLFQVVARFPEGLGQLKFLKHRVLRRASGLIEYK